MTSGTCLLSCARETTQLLPAHRTHQRETASDAYYNVPVAPCLPQYDGGPAQLVPYGYCGTDQWQQSEVEMTWQELMSLSELQGLDAEGELNADPTIHCGSSYPPPPPPLAPPPPPPLDPYCLAPGPCPAWSSPVPALGLPGYPGPFDPVPPGPGPGAGCFPPAPLQLLPESAPCHYAPREEGGSDSGLSLDSSPHSEGYGGESWGGVWAYGGGGGGAQPPLPAPQPPGGAPRGKREGGPSRDARRAQALRIPLPTEAIVNLPVEDFNEALSRHRLSEQQLALARDIRRRGKNKVAAHNCRRRKLENIARLEGELGVLRRRREGLAAQRQEAGRQLRAARRRLEELARRVFAALRDPQGRPYSPRRFTLRQGADGAVLLVPRVEGEGEGEGTGGDSAVLPQH